MLCSLTNNADCSCRDPLLNQCYLVHPGKLFYSSGPYNRAFGERLLAMYQEHDLTKGRVMLVDEDLVSYFMKDDRSTKAPDHASMPPGLLHEYHELLDGHGRSSLIEQELEFDRLFRKNMSMKHPLTMTKLQSIQRQAFGTKVSV